MNLSESLLMSLDEALIFRTSKFNSLLKALEKDGIYLGDRIRNRKGGEYTYRALWHEESGKYLHLLVKEYADDAKTTRSGEYKAEIIGWTLSDQKTLPRSFRPEQFNKVDKKVRSIKEIIELSGIKSYAKSQGSSVGNYEAFAIIGNKQRIADELSRRYKYPFADTIKVQKMVYGVNDALVRITGEGVSLDNFIQAIKKVAPNVEASQQKMVVTFFRSAEGAPVSLSVKVPVSTYSSSKSRVESALRSAFNNALVGFRSIQIQDENEHEVILTVRGEMFATMVSNGQANFDKLMAGAVSELSKISRDIEVSDKRLMLSKAKDEAPVPYSVVIEIDPDAEDEDPYSLRSFVLSTLRPYSSEFKSEISGNTLKYTGSFKGDRGMTADKVSAQALHNVETILQRKQEIGVVVQYSIN